MIVLGVECMKMVAFNVLTSGHMDSFLNRLNNPFAISMYNTLTNTTVEGWMYNNSNIQRSNIRTYGPVLESAIYLMCNLHTQYSLPITVWGVECTKMVAFNALTSGHINSCLNQLKAYFWTSDKIFLSNNSLGCWMYENGSIQLSNIRTYWLVLESANYIICNLHTQ